MSKNKQKGKLQVSLIRDFRAAGAPLGYVCVQADTYYAWWSLDEPATIHAEQASGSGEGYLDLEVGGWLEFMDGTMLCPDEFSMRPGGNAVETWGGGGKEMDEFSMEFTSPRKECVFKVLFRPESISNHMFCQGPFANIARCGLGGTQQGRKSAFNARKVFNPCPASHGIYHHPLSRPQKIRPDWFTPAPYCFAFEGHDAKWFTASLEAPAGEMSFHSFATLPEKGGRMAFSVIYNGFRPSANFASPPLVLRFGAGDEIQAIERYANGMVDDGTVARHQKDLPEWWRGVMLCGWHQQLYVAKKRKCDPGNACTQEVYGDFISDVQDKGIRFDMITVDMGWSESLGIWEPDTSRWPDLQGFVRDQHDKGRKVILWLSTGVHGLPANELYKAGKQTLLDPLNPSWRKRVRKCFKNLFGKNSINADGIKFDFTDIVPHPGEHQGTKELHGLDYLYELFSLVSTEARRVKADILLDYQVAHPAFAHLHGMTRLNDFFLPVVQAPRVMKWRAAIAKAATFGNLVDVDGPVSEEYFVYSHKMGNPSFYISQKDLSDPKLCAAMRKAVSLFHQ